MIYSISTTNQLSLFFSSSYIIFKSSTKTSLLLDGTFYFPPSLISFFLPLPPSICSYILLLFHLTLLHQHQWYGENIYLHPRHLIIFHNPLLFSPCYYINLLCPLILTFPYPFPLSFGGGV